MDTVVITGAAGLIGSETARFFSQKQYRVIGVDNDMRRQFFGDEASTAWNRARLEEELPDYVHYATDIRDQAAVERLFKEYSSDIRLVVHAAAQPSHDWAARDPLTDFSVNAQGTLIMLEAVRQHTPEAVFVHLSTNKVYGDTPNNLPLVEQESRWEVAESHPYFARGIDEGMSIDNSTHSLFGVSKAASDLLVQEYGRYFGLKSCCLRGGCLTGPSHSGTQLHGFLAYLMKCAATGAPYTVFGYKGKQVRDNIHSYDLVNAVHHFFRKPRAGEVYNMGGSRFSNCSMLEAIEACEQIAGRKMNVTYSDQNRIGDHIWYISDVSKFQNHYPDWSLTYDIPAILKDIYEAGIERWQAEARAAS